MKKWLILSIFFVFIAQGARADVANFEIYPGSGFFASTTGLTLHTNSLGFPPDLAIVFSSGQGQCYRVTPAYFDLTLSTPNSSGDCSGDAYPTGSPLPPPTIEFNFYNGTNHFGGPIYLCADELQYTTDPTLATDCGLPPPEPPHGDFLVSTSTASTTAELIGTVQMASGIIIVILMVYLIAYLYNSLFKKKQWQH